MKPKSPTAIIYYLCAFVFYILATINSSDGEHSIDIVWMCIGTAFLCLGTIMLRRNSKKDDNDDSQDGSEE